MSAYYMNVLVNIDDELLADHDGDNEAPPNEIDEWYGGDLERALENGIAELEHDPIKQIVKVVDG